MKLKARLLASFEATRPGVAEFGIMLSIAILVAGGSLGLLPR